MNQHLTGQAAFASTATRITQRVWIRHDRPIWPFIWRGLVPCLGLLLLALYAFLPFAHDEIQATLAREMRAQLDAQGYTWVKVKVSGQNVTLSGEQPKEGDGDTALILAHAVTCPSWTGRLSCPVGVVGQFTSATAVAAPAPAEKVAAAKACEQQLAQIMDQAKIEFATGSAEISPRSQPLLDRLGTAAHDCPGVIHVEGHTDSQGEAVANQALSRQRAAAVREALVKRGVAAQRLLSEGYGATRPLADNGTEAGRQQNRRIEFHVDVEKN